MEIKNSLLMAIATIGTLLLLYLLIFYEVPKENTTIILALTGPMLGFYFGSSVNKQRPPQRETDK